MAIGALIDNKQYSFMHDLEAFFWVLFWVFIHYQRPVEARVVARFDGWNFMDTEELVGMNDLSRPMRNH